MPLFNNPIQPLGNCVGSGVIREFRIDSGIERYYSWHTSAYI